jgi:FlaA1/EpsC-like NDP-sugar epimerase
MTRNERGINVLAAPWAGAGTMKPWGGPQAKRWIVLFSLDGVAAAAALWAAFWLRFDGRVPAGYREALPRAVLLLVVSRIACNRAASLHRWSFRLSGLSDALRIGAAGFAGSVAFIVLSRTLVQAWMPRTVLVLEFFLSTTLAGAARFGPRTVLRWLRLVGNRGGSARTLIIGAGSEAELLSRDLRRNGSSPHRVVGFVSANGETTGTRLDGVRVLGAVSDLPRLIRRHGVTTVLLAERCREPSRIREIVETCASSRVSFKIVPAAAERFDRLSFSMLDDVSPQDLLPRDSVAFDEEAIRGLVKGRRALVTGAGGSIGSELSRQLARFGARQLVLVDMNENELYLGARRLADEHPGVEVRTEVADIREAESLRKLGERHRPEDVFHAAAHKHVPLMEEAPEEAVKNNVFGTLNAAHMAHLSGAERFVLISTDKAVKPTSVMGATKRVAELVIRDLGRSSRTQMTAVRFGNVLGSAGSVLPLFKDQIARGGPVTVTHPQCTRYFMTVSEAVGLTLLAGLGGYGDLCVLDMGEPIRIADLARFMIALSGRADEIEIVYTGLRPGEKLTEELLTEDEERSQTVRDRIRVTQSPPPPADLERWLSELKRLAQAGDRGAILSVLRALVPTYTVTKNVVDPSRPPLGPKDEVGPRGASRPVLPVLTPQLSTD